MSRLAQKAKSTVAKVAAAVTKKLKGKKKAKASDAEAEASGVKLMTAKAATKKLKKKLGRAPTDDEVAAFVAKINKKRSTKATKRKAGSSDDEEEGQGEADAAPAKKAKKANKGKKDAEASAEAEAEADMAAGADGGETEAEAGQISMDKPFKKGPKVNTPFRRVISENIVVHRELEDNTYEGTFGENGAFTPPMTSSPPPPPPPPPPPSCRPPTHTRARAWRAHTPTLLLCARHLSSLPMPPLCARTICSRNRRYPSTCPSGSPSARSAWL